MKAQQKWVRDYELKTTVYRIGDVCVSLEPHPPGLFGQYVGDVHGIPNFDHEKEKFPRYYMQRDRAEAELIDWLRSRVRA